MGAVVLDGATVGPHALVAAGSLVREGFTVPPRTLVAGVPARVVRQLTDAEVEALYESARHYVAYARRYQEQGRTGV
jgi:carbonic anhydrase/acetyltransferase-like protein (isoleucine patch superfamily)